jgi:hypothetical protein
LTSIGHTSGVALADIALPDVALPDVAPPDVASPGVGTTTVRDTDVVIGAAALGLAALGPATVRSATSAEFADWLDVLFAVRFLRSRPASLLEARINAIAIIITARVKDRHTRISILLIFDVWNRVMDPALFRNGILGMPCREEKKTSWSHAAKGWQMCSGRIAQSLSKTVDGQGRIPANNQDLQHPPYESAGLRAGDS